ncbi:hypothetical protein ANANG_G00250180 [Anguilla anguilla]|uniref:BED-type domain-containing protein n=1 Tax=Anguilla anguilla TaxID=7936 RepID=A0A9D3LUP6_ANGAN|nr:hypothetical protein ANANG_G00250180 [Anguilla anguilla]
MASNSRVSILDYFNIVFEGENGKIESNCKACGTRIQAKRTVTSNFVTHLKRKHQAMYDEFVKKKDVKREAYSSGGVQQHMAGRSEPARSSHAASAAIAKFDRNDPRQVLISEAIAKMIIRDLQAVQIVENEGFRDLLQLLEPRYTPEPRHYIQQQLLPGYAYQRRGRGRAGGPGGYLGVTCHFLTADWQIKSALLACLPLSGHGTAQRVLSEFDEISHAHGITGKVFRVVADPFPCEGRAAFRLPGFCLHGVEEEEDEEEDSSDEELSIALTKAACFYNYVTATVAPEKLGQVFGTGMAGVARSPGPAPR